MSLPTKSREYHLPKRDGIDCLEIREVPIPSLQSSEVLVKVMAVSLQYRDLMVAKNIYPMKMKDDVVPCSDLAGVVIATGSTVKNWKKGDRVCSDFSLDHIDGDITPEIKDTGLGAPIDGVLREYIVLPDHSLVKFPEHLSFEEASTLPCAGVTAYNALYGPHPLKAGDTVLVIGTGGVSIFALQFAVAAGAVVIALSSSQEKIDKAKKLGATHVINYKEVENWDEKVLELTDGRGVDHVIEVGGAGTLPRSVNAVRHAGYVHVIGFVAGKTDVSQLPVTLVTKACILRGILIGSVRQFNEMDRAITAAKIHPVVDRVFEFEEAKDAYRYLESQKHVGKVVIRVAKE
jgi:NADPH:quinone reductase-like Zn-dependent oxidoreductase